MPQLRESQRSLLRSACLIRVPECRRAGVGSQGVKGVREEDTIFNEVSLDGSRQGIDSFSLGSHAQLHVYLGAICGGSMLRFPQDY